MPSGWTAPHFALSGDDIAVASVTRGWTFGKIARLVTVEPIGRALWLEAKQARGIAAEDCGLDGSVSSRSEEHTSELQSLMRISYAVFCLKKQHKHKKNQQDEEIRTT